MYFGIQSIYQTALQYNPFLPITLYTHETTLPYPQIPPSSIHTFLYTMSLEKRMKKILATTNAALKCLSPILLQRQRKLQIRLHQSRGFSHPRPLFRTGAAVGFLFVKAVDVKLHVGDVEAAFGFGVVPFFVFGG